MTEYISLHRIKKRNVSPLGVTSSGGNTSRLRLVQL